jgi:hypothetical protein
MTEIFIGFLFAGNGLILYLVKRGFEKKDKSAELVTLVKKVVETNNRQGEEIVILSDLVNTNIKLNKSLIYALHEKGVFNGNTVEFNRQLDEMEDKLQSYTKSKKDESLFIAQ